MQENISQNEIQVLDLHFFKVYNLKMAGISRRPTKFMAENGMSRIEMISAKSLLAKEDRWTTTFSKCPPEQIAANGHNRSCIQQHRSQLFLAQPHWSHLQQTANRNTAVLLALNAYYSRSIEENECCSINIKDDNSNSTYLKQRKR